MVCYPVIHSWCRDRENPRLENWAFLMVRDTLEGRASNGVPGPARYTHWNSTGKVTLSPLALAPCWTPVNLNSPLSSYSPFHPLLPGSEGSCCLVLAFAFQWCRLVSGFTDLVLEPHSPLPSSLHDASLRPSASATATPASRQTAHCNGKPQSWII